MSLFLLDMSSKTKTELLKNHYAFGAGDNLDHCLSVAESMANTIADMATATSASECAIDINPEHLAYTARHLMTLIQDAQIIVAGINAQERDQR